MFLRKFVLFWTILLFLNSFSYSQTGFIPVELDYAFFRGSEGKTYIEIYLSVQSNTLKYLEEENILRAKFNVTVNVSQENSVISSKSKNLMSEMNSGDVSQEDRKFATVFAFELPQGIYKVQAIVQDINSEKKGEYVTEMNTPGISDEMLATSSIELASKIDKASGESEFNKNNYYVFPNPGNSYNISSPMMYYYTEIYNLVSRENDHGTYTTHSFITDKDGKVVKDFGEQSHTKPGKSAVLVGGHNIVTLKDDVYFLNIVVTDRQSGKKTTQVKQFNFSKPEKIAVSAGGAVKENMLDVSEYASFTETELDKEFEMASYIALSQEIDIYKTLPREEKRKFLVTFWNRRNEAYQRYGIKNYKLDYLDRVKYANQYYPSGSREGWQTDRGRNLLKYGKPNEIERNRLSLDTKPYEIWHYFELEGGVLFVFADLDGFGNYQLIHSTLTGEINNPNWETLINK